MISVQLSRWCSSDSGDDLPCIQGRNFSPGRSRISRGSKKIIPTENPRTSSAAENPTLLSIQDPAASEEETPSVFEPHISPLALACSSFGKISMAMASVATSWKAEKKLKYDTGNHHRTHVIKGINDGRHTYEAEDNSNLPKEYPWPSPSHGQVGIPVDERAHDKFETPGDDQYTYKCPDLCGRFTVHGHPGRKAKIQDAIRNTLRKV